MQAPSTRMPSMDSMASWAASRTSNCIQRCGCRKNKISLPLFSRLKLSEKGLGKGPKIMRMDVLAVLGETVTAEYEF